MKLKSLKFLTGSITAFSMLVSVMACNDESGNNSTKADEKDTSAASTPVSTETAKKKSGKASTQSTTDATGKKIEKDKMGYYTTAEVVPSYNGGQSALETYITNSIQYPQDAIDNNVEGTVNVQFLVDEKGAVSNVTTVGNKIGSGLEEEAVRVVTAMPKWTPGQVKGKTVKTWRTLPITYRLES